MSLLTQSLTYWPKQVTLRTSFHTVFLCLVPVILVGWAVMRYTQNLPHWDDFQIQTNLLFSQGGLGSQKLIHLFDQHWEHRVVWTHVIFALFANLNGTLTYYDLTLIGVSRLLVILWILFAVSKADAVNLTLSLSDNGTYVFLKSSSHTYLSATCPLRPSTLIFRFTNYFNPNALYTQVLKEELEPGHYRIGVLTNQKNHIHLAMTNRCVTFTSL